jgi:hypothetical protein
MPRKGIRDRYLGLGLCGNCGTLPLSLGKTSCEQCLIIIRESNKRTRRKLRKSMPPKTKEDATERLERLRQKGRNRNKKIRNQVLDHYGRQCACCNEATEQFLSIDHVDNDGASHRRAVRGHNGGSIYCWLIANGFPLGFQTLCYNCNFAKGRYGICPHETARTLERLNAGDIQQTRESVLGVVGNTVPALLEDQDVDGTVCELSRFKLKETETWH